MPGGYSSEGTAGVNGGGATSDAGAGGGQVGAGGVAGESGTGAGAGESGTGAGAGPVGGSGPRPLFADDFEDGIGRWEIVEGTGWTAFADTPTNTVFQSAVASGARYIAFEPTRKWTDQIAHARVKVLEFGGTSGGDTAVLFARFNSATNHYQAALRPDGRASIRACVAGATSTIKTSAILGITTGVWYELKLEVVGDSLRLYVDERLVASILDNRIKDGGVAVGGVNSAAQFDDVSVYLP